MPNQVLENTPEMQFINSVPNLLLLDELEIALLRDYRAKIPITANYIIDIKRFDKHFKVQLLGPPRKPGYYAHHKHLFKWNVKEEANYLRDMVRSKRITKPLAERQLADYSASRAPPVIIQRKDLFRNFDILKSQRHQAYVQRLSEKDEQGDIKILELEKSYSDFNI